MTLAEYLQAFFAAPAKVSPKTLERYRELAERQIIPHLGALKLQKLRPEHIEQWHGTLLKTGLAPRTVGHAHRLLARVLGYAVENGTLARNVAAIRKPPKVEEREIEILTADQIAEVRTKLAGHTLLPIVELALATGMRRGELLGLQWGDVDLDAGTLRVERSRRGDQGRSPAEAAKDEARPAQHQPAAKAPSPCCAPTRCSKWSCALLSALGAIKPDTLVFSTIEGELLSPRQSEPRLGAGSGPRKKLPPVPFQPDGTRTPQC